MLLEGQDDELRMAEQRKSNGFNVYEHVFEDDVQESSDPYVAIFQVKSWRENPHEVDSTRVLATIHNFETASRVNDFDTPDM